MKIGIPPLQGWEDVNAWSKNGAKKYFEDKLIKVRIHLDDVAALVHKGDKLRCTRLEVIEEL